MDLARKSRLQESQEGKLQAESALRPNLSHVPFTEGTLPWRCLDRKLETQAYPHKDRIMTTQLRKIILASTLALLTSVASAGNHGNHQQKDIVDTAVAAGSFTTLVAALEAAGLVETLKGEGPFTVFAPTDAAFAALPAGTLESLLDPANQATLQSILTYHVLPGKVMSADIAGQTLAPATVQGTTVAIDATDGVKVKGANVVTADIEASNGVIHVIDAVILPE